MVRGIYIAASGMLTESMRQDVIANNLANANTTGFKRSQVVASEFDSLLLRNLGVPGAPAIGELQYGSQVEDIVVIDQQGKLKATDNPLDLALSGPGYFAVDTPEGRRYTRDGSFQVDEQGRLVTKEGHVVAGQNGAITIGPGGNVDIGVAEDGTVSQGQRILGRITVTNLDPASLAKQGDSLVDGTIQAGETGGVRQGFLEASTVNVVSEMVELIRVMRSFEASQRAVRAHDEALTQSATQVASVG